MEVQPEVLWITKAKKFKLLLKKGTLEEFLGILEKETCVSRKEIKLFFQTEEVTNEEKFQELYLEPRPWFLHTVRRVELFNLKGEREETILPPLVKNWRMSEEIMEEFGFSKEGHRILATLWDGKEMELKHLPDWQQREISTLKAVKNPDFLELNLELDRYTPLKLFVERKRSPLSLWRELAQHWDLVMERVNIYYLLKGKGEVLLELEKLPATLEECFSELEEPVRLVLRLNRNEGKGTGVVSLCYHTGRVLHSFLVNLSSLVQENAREIWRKFPEQERRELFLSARGGTVLRFPVSWKEQGVANGSKIWVVPRGLQVFLVTPSPRKTLTLYLDPEETVEFFKQRVYGAVGVPVEQQRLVSNGKHLEDDKPIHYFGVGRESTIHLLLALRGGGARFGFADVSNSKALRSVEFACSAPPWQVACAGVSIVGFCRNKSCVAGKIGAEVLYKHGYMNFELPRDLSKVRCPMCLSHVTPINCGFTDCWWKVQGVKRTSSSQEERYSSSWKEAKDDYTTFDTWESGVVEWKELKILVRGRNEVGRVRVSKGGSLEAIELFCFACFRKVQNAFGVLLADCGHSFHERCFSSLRENGRDCLVCGSELSHWTLRRE